MDFFKDKQSEHSEGGQHTEKYHPGTPIVPLHGKPPAPASIAEYQQANARKLGEVDFDRRRRRRDDYDDEDGNTVWHNLWHFILWPLRLGCRGCGCLILVVLVGGCVLITYTVFAKPAFLWGPLSTILNGDAPGRVAVVAAQPSIDYNTATRQIVSQTSQFRIGSNTLRITQQQFQAIVRQMFQQSSLTNIHTIITPEQVELLWNFNQDTERQVWFVVRLGLEEDSKLKVKHIGFNNLGLPAFLNSAITNTALATLNVKDGESADDILTKILNLPDTARVTKIELKQEQIDVRIELTSGLDNLFN